MKPFRPDAEGGPSPRCSGRAVGQAAGAFTLIELVLSAALMSMILAGAYLCLRAGISSQKLVDSRQEILQNARVALNLVSADLRGACPLSKDIEFVGMHRTLGEIEADNLDFATHNYTPRRARESDWCEVSYFLDREPQSGQLSLWRRRDPTPDEEPLAGGSREEIARGLHGLKFEYYDGFDWYEEWGDAEGRGKAATSMRERSNLSGLPEAVRVTLWFDSHPGSTNQVSNSKATPAEPPLVFQTVARLNLAAAALQSSSSGASTNTPAAAPAQQPQPPPGGPTP